MSALRCDVADHTIPASLRLARAVLRAVSLRERSYDNAAADAAYVASLEGGATLALITTGDYSQFYRMTLLQACEQADRELAQPVYIMLQDWNAAIGWAETRKKEG